MGDARPPTITIACDLDDVLAQTNEMVASLHNELHGTDLVMEDFRYYHYWRNRGWGTPAETVQKVRDMFSRGVYRNSLPVDGAAEGLAALKELDGVRLVVVTARGEDARETSQRWLNERFPGVFDELYFTGAFTHLDTDGETGPVVSPRSHPLKKSEVLAKIGASVLIDDALENALDMATTAIPCLLFGAYPWNRRSSATGSKEREQMSYDEVRAAGLQHLEDEEDLVRDEDLPRGITRVDDWPAVVAWAKANLAVA